MVFLLFGRFFLLGSPKYAEGRGLIGMFACAARAALGVLPVRPKCFQSLKKSELIFVLSGRCEDNVHLLRLSRWR